MPPWHHSIRKASDLVIINDGRGTSTLPWDEFLQLAYHIAEVASGTPESISEQRLVEMEQRESFSSADGLALLTSLGLATPSLSVKRRKIG